jgi:hypothetical protein
VEILIYIFYFASAMTIALFIKVFKGTPTVRRYVYSSYFPVNDRLWNIFNEICYIHNHYYYM